MEMDLCFCDVLGSVSIAKVQATFAAFETAPYMYPCSRYKPESADSDVRVTP